MQRLLYFVSGNIFFSYLEKHFLEPLLLTEVLSHFFLINLCSCWQDGSMIKACANKPDNLSCASQNPTPIGCSLTSTYVQECPYIYKHQYINKQTQGELVLNKSVTLLKREEGKKQQQQESMWYVHL